MFEELHAYDTVPRSLGPHGLGSIVYADRVISMYPEKCNVSASCRRCFTVDKGDDVQYLAIFAHRTKANDITMLSYL